MFFNREREFTLIKLEKYSTLIGIEAQVLSDISRNHIIPTAVRYQNTLIKNVKGLKEVFGDKEFKKYAKEQLDLIASISDNISGIKSGVDKLLAAKAKANSIEDPQKQAEAFCFDVKTLFDAVRICSDNLEMMVDDELWPLPKYRELLFSK